MRTTDGHNLTLFVRLRVLLPIAGLCLCAVQTSVAAPQEPQAITSYEPCGVESAAKGQVATTAALEGAQPGVNDPLGVPASRYMLFPDQGVGTFEPNPYMTFQTVFYQTDADSTLGLGNSTIIRNPTGTGNPFFAAAGKILTPDHDNLVYATRVGAANQIGSVSVRFAQEGPSVTLPEPLIPQPGNSTDSIAIAQGDLDKVVDQNGQPHNEVVVAHVSREDGGYYRYDLDVLNYSAGNVSSPDVTSAYVVDIAPRFITAPPSTPGVLAADNTMALAIGDFDGDGNQEIALAFLGDWTIIVYTFRYQTVNGVHSLNVLSSWVEGGHGFLVGGLSAAAGNLDGKGPDELILSYVDYGENPLRYIVSAMVLKYSGTTPADVNTYHLTVNPPVDTTFAVTGRPIVQLATGQFLFQPPGIALGRRQLAIAYADDGVQTSTIRLHIQMLSYSSDLSSATPVGPLYNDALASNIPANPMFSMAAGGFQGVNAPARPGNSTPGAPVSTLALGIWMYPSYVSPGTRVSEFWVQTFFVDPSLGPVLANSVRSQRLAYAPVSSARLPVIAYDLQGKTLYVGAPAHITVTGAARTDVILQEPPKHAYWDEISKSVVNLTRHDTNNVHLYNSTSSSFLTSSTDEASRNTGGSLTASVGGTVSLGKSMLIGSANASASVDATIRGSYDYNEHSSEYNSGYNSRTISSQSSTDHDDYLSGEVQTFDVWRYRIYGTPNTSQTNTFYELIFPGPKVPFSGGGLDFDWYQPVHENGNILSYPAALGPPSNPFLPTDLGTITLPDGTEHQEPLVPAALSTFNGSGTSVQLAYSSEVATGKSFTYSHELAESADVTVNYTASADVLGYGTEVRACGSIGFHNSNSWGGSKTSNETSKTETAITLNRAAGVSSYSYPFYPVVYTTQDGTLKMASMVPNPGQKASNPGNYQTYANLYGGKQDPALNLPWRFDSYIITPGQVGWLPNLRTDRKQMRGLFFRQPDVNEVTGTYDFVSANPTPGDTVRVEARIYNYSTNMGALYVPVQFEAIPYDSGTNSEICESPINAASGKTAGLLCPPSARTTIGQTTIPSLAPLQWTCLDGVDDASITFCAPPVFIDWDTTHFGSPYSGTAEYRIYVVLNADGSAGPETYGWEGNPVPITNVAGNPMQVTAPGNTFNYGDYVTIGGVEGLDQANGIFQIGEFSNAGDTFALNTCQPSPPCAASAVPGRTPYSKGGTATLLDPGQNNEGYGYIGITTPPVQAADSPPVTPTDYLDYNSLEAVRTIGPLVGTLAESWTNAYLYDHQDLRFTVYSNTVHQDAAEVLLFDGDPARGAPAIAEKTIHPGANGPDGESVWFDWQPTTRGLHKLFAVLVEGTGPQEKVELDVNVTNGNPASQ